MPASGTFTVFSNIYIVSHLNGTIYDSYVTVNYTDGTTGYFSSALSADEITANLNTWKKYNLTFTTNQSKTISSIGCWCLVWSANGNPFNGTVYFDKMRLAVSEPEVVYWWGEHIYSATDKDQAAADVLYRGFTYAIVNQNDQIPNQNGDSNVAAIFLNSKNFKLVKAIGPHASDSQYFHTPRYYSPYNQYTTYNSKKTELTNYLNTYTDFIGIYDDIEQPPFPGTTYSADGGTVTSYTFADLEYRIGNQTHDNWGTEPAWPVFKDSHNVTNLTMNNIEYNFPSPSIDNSSTPPASAIIGEYDINYGYQPYEMAAQTFTPTVSTWITRIDVRVKRSSSAAYPAGNLYYYLTQVDAQGKPDLTLTKRLPYPNPNCTIRSNETDMSSTPRDGMLSLYFDPVDVGQLAANTKYALVLEFSKKDSNGSNNAYYQVAGFNTDVYSGGQYWRRTRRLGVQIPPGVPLFSLKYDIP